MDKIKAATHEDADAKTLILRERRGVSPLVCRNVAENLSTFCLISANKKNVPHQILNNLTPIIQFITGLVLQEIAKSKKQCASPI